MKDNLTSFFDITQKMLEQINDMIRSEQEKRNALLNHEGEKIESLLQEQQAKMMKLEGLEKKRLAAQSQAGFEGLSSSEILAKLPKDASVLFVRLFSDLQNAASQLQELNQLSLEIATTELNLMQHFAGASPEHQANLYQPSGKKRVSSHLGKTFEEKI